MGYYESLAKELSSSNMYADQNSGVARRCPLSRKCRLQNSRAGNLHCKCLDKKDSLCIVGDLEPIDFLGAYEDNPGLEKDWGRVISYKPKRIYYAHVNEMMQCD